MKIQNHTSKRKIHFSDAESNFRTHDKVISEHVTVISEQLRNSKPIREKVLYFIIYSDTLHHLNLFLC